MIQPIGVRPSGPSMFRSGFEADLDADSSMVERWSKEPFVAGSSPAPKTCAVNIVGRKAFLSLTGGS